MINEHLKKEKIHIFGSTGTVGLKALELIRKQSNDTFEVLGLTCNKNWKLLLEQIDAFKPKIVSVGDGLCYEKIRSCFPALHIVVGKEGLREVTQIPSDRAVMGISGFPGVYPTLELAKTTKVLALANKETIIVAYHILKKILNEFNTTLIPVDSEHSSLYQLLDAFNTSKKNELDKLILTASGGPFFQSTIPFASITQEMALKHPTWLMGKKISIDSATMMNKGLEILEAVKLFNIHESKIDVWVHPESLLHGALLFKNQSWVGHFSLPDMSYPLAYALGLDEKNIQWSKEPFDIKSFSNLHFFPPDADKFPSLTIARSVAQSSDTSLAVVLNTANEVAVEAFLDKKITFDKIFHLVIDTLLKHQPRLVATWEEIESLDEAIRRSMKCEHTYL